MSFKFVHTADLHLDSPLKALALRDPDLAATVGTATRTVLTRIVDLCLAQSVDALLISGDLWDGKYSSTKTPLFLKSELIRLDKAGIKCFIIRGNHDAESKLSAELDAPANTTIFSARGGTQEFLIGDMAIAVHGLSMKDPHVSESLLPRYPAPVAGAFNIGMMHTSLDGSADHDLYAPCARVDLDRFGYNYWALGHIHKRAVYQGAATIVMPGIPQGRDIGEAGEASVSIVHVSADHHVQVEVHAIAAVQFDRVPIDLTPVTDWAGVITAIGRGLLQVQHSATRAETMVLRPVLTGVTDLAWRIRRDRDRLTNEAQAIALGLDSIWIDKIEIALSDPIDAPNVHLPPELVSLVLAVVQDDAAVQLAVKEAWDEFVADMPADMRDLLGDSPAKIDLAQRELLADGAQDILMHLTIDKEAD